MKDNFTRITNTILHASQATNIKTGEVVKISSDVKIAYMYMLDQYEMHKRFGNREYRESLDSIRLRLPVSLSVIKRITCDLKKLGLLEVKGRKNAVKILYKIEDVTEWSFTNPQLEDFKKPENKIKRQEEKASRFKEYENKIEEQAQAEVTQQPVVETKEAEEVETFINEMGNEDVNFNQDVPMPKPQPQPEPQPQPQPKQVVPIPQDNPVQDTPEQFEYNMKCKQLLRKYKVKDHEGHTKYFARLGLEGILKAVNEDSYTIQGETFSFCARAAIGVIHAMLQNRFYRDLENGEIFDRIEEVLA